MPIDPSIIGNVMVPQAPQLPDVNAMMQTRTAGMENIYKIETARQEQAKLAQKEQQAAIAQMMLPSVAAAFSDPSDAGLAQAEQLMPPEAAETFAPFMDRLRSVPDPKLRQALLRAELLKDDEGKLILAQLEPTANMRLQADTAAAAQALKMRELQLKEQTFAASGGVSPDVAARLEFDREKFAAEQAEKEAKARGEIGPTEAQKGEVWNPEKQRYDVVPGTKLYRESAAKHTEDYKAKTAVQDRVAESLAKIDYVLADENKDGFEYNFGGYYAAYAGQYMPVEQAQDVKNTIESLKADITQAGLELMRSGGSIGAITEREWPLLEKQIAAVTPYVGEKRARELLQNVAQRLRNIQARATQAYDQQWGDTQFYEPSEALPVETGDSEEELPEGTTSSNW